MVIRVFKAGEPAPATIFEGRADEVRIDEWSTGRVELELPVRVTGGEVKQISILLEEEDVAHIIGRIAATQL